MASVKPSVPPTDVDPSWSDNPSFLGCPSQEHLVALQGYLVSCYRAGGATFLHKATNEILKKKHKEKLLKDRPETLYSDLYKNEEVSDIIFYTEDPEAWHSAIRQHYPTVIRKGISNGWKLQVKEEDDSESDVMITANLYKNGTVMIQGNMKKIENDFLQIKGKAQLNKTGPNTLKQEENTSISTHQATNERSGMTVRRSPF
ncbi:hypothetical protein G5714_016461 [Onychostoma macrolepis]|uniref:Uncharacterized protein n=1 Tax=Onychostoma macrolepis TaxID=369639 RepID=A0A7J6C8F2_9TELE|nr:hypothetical protein G5714_016461 [Onychostoma macrolepis]